MDEATQLVSELQQKLSELDRKVWQYRQDMAAEFTKYAENALRHVPKDVCETVNKAIAESMKAYKSLDPDSLSSAESCATCSDSLAHHVANGAPSSFANATTTMLFQSEDQEVPRPRSPHEREKEFRGVFTPSYLPLLDSADQRERESYYEPQPSYSSEDKGKGKDMMHSHVDASTDTRSLASSPEFRRPDTPKRKNTDEWSVTSEASDGPVRRSALRRSSSSSKPVSPRRVRFDVAGEEVLPTASPLSAQSINFEDIPAASFDSSEDEAELEQVEDIDEIPIKRISSSQALRALSRSPLEEDGTQWTTVSAPPDGSASIPAVSNNYGEDLDEDLFVEAKKPSVHFETSTEPVAIPEKATQTNLATKAANQTGDNAHDADTVSDDEMLDMPPLKQMKKSPATMLSPIRPANRDTSTAPTSATRLSKPSLNLNDFLSDQAEKGEAFQFTEDEHEGFFPFDESNEPNNQRSPPEEEQADSDSGSPLSPTASSGPLAISSFSKSPAREIPQPTTAAPEPEHEPESTPLPTKGVVGSYKGRPFSMPIVSDEMHAQAASLGAMNSFVGSVNGRSGLDESDVQSFHKSGGIGSFSGQGSFSGTPRSLSERLMMDEVMEEAEKRRLNPEGNQSKGGR